MDDVADRPRLYPRGELIIREVGLRDGLQLVRQFPSSADKAAWVAADYKAGIRHFEIGSYLPQNSFPQFADVDEMVDVVRGLEGAYASTLVLNGRGASRAMAGRSDELVCVVSASEEHNLANARRSRADTLREIRELAASVRHSDRQPVLAVGITMSFGCSIAGKSAVPQSEVLHVAEACLDAGVQVLNIADTVGYANPNEVGGMVMALRRVAGDVPIGVHIHDTRGLGIANVAAALDHGVDFVDASLGGLGGCPFAPGASGNVVLEDVLFLAQSMGFPVACEVEHLREARDVVARAMPWEHLLGHIALAGMPL